VEICKPELSKVYALKHLCEISGANRKITYVGDEFDCGNDADSAQHANHDSNVKCLHVDGPAKTGFFIATLIAHLTRNASR
jgi:hypothetical protein